MDNMRFGGQNPSQQTNEVRPRRASNFKSILLTAVILVVLGAIGWYFYTSKVSLMEKYKDLSGSDYYAVFLSNGQVYFGKLLESNRKDIVLNEVYYLQLSGQGDATTSTSAEARFGLVKLGQELHGPTDKLYVNREHVLFVEQLKSDSKVVASIKSGK